MEEKKDMIPAEKGEYIEQDERFQEAESAPTEEEPAIPEEDPDAIPMSFVRGVNQYQLRGIIIGYAMGLMLTGLFGIVGIYESQSTLIPCIFGMLAGYGFATSIARKTVEKRHAARKAAEQNQKAE